jgi:NAD(P)-dependent dehydrogenase (short-subunit alcohol dehydrogenase family)
MSTRTGRLQGKTAIITGGARGIGATTAALFAREGAAVAILDMKDELGKKACAGIEAAGGRGAYFHCDVTQAAAVERAVSQAAGALGGAVHVLFNNAGTCIDGGVEKISEADWDRTFAVNVKSMFLLSRAVVPLMRRAGGGSIINMGSESGIVGFPMHPAYCASKGAVVNLTKSMALGHAADRIRVNCLCPGTIPTPLYHEFIDQLPNKDEVVAMLKREHPLGLGTEEDIAQAALFLASDESRYMTGANLVVDGGYTAK